MYIFYCDIGFMIVYVGFFNLFNFVLISGMEWNFKVMEKDLFDVLCKIEVIFESYWNDCEFIRYVVENERYEVQLKVVLNCKKDNLNVFYFDIQFYDY